MLYNKIKIMFAAASAACVVATGAAGQSASNNVNPFFYEFSNPFALMQKDRLSLIKQNNFFCVFEQHNPESPVTAVVLVMQDSKKEEMLAGRALFSGDILFTSKNAFNSDGPDDIYLFTSKGAIKLDPFNIDEDKKVSLSMDAVNHVLRITDFINRTCPTRNAGYKPQKNDGQALLHLQR